MWRMNAFECAPLTARTLDQELGVGWVEVIHPDDALQCLSTYSEAFDARRDFEIECRALRHDGCYRWHLNRGRPMLAPDGRFRGYVGTVIDVTDRRRAEAQREELLADGFRDFRTRTGIEADLVLTGSDERIDTDVAETPYSTARAALANVELHSRAGAVLLGLHISSRSVSLSVQDDGDGALPEVDAD
jgi:hypothetical protein